MKVGAARCEGPLSQLKDSDGVTPLRLTVRLRRPRRCPRCRSAVHSVLQLIHQLAERRAGCFETACARRDSQPVRWRSRDGPEQPPRSTGLRSATRRTLHDGHAPSYASTRSDMKAKANNVAVHFGGPEVYSVKQLPVGCWPLRAGNARAEIDTRLPLRPRVIAPTDHALTAAATRPGASALP